MRAERLGVWATRRDLLACLSSGKIVKKRILQTYIHPCWNLDQIFLETPEGTSKFGTDTWHGTKPALFGSAASLFLPRQTDCSSHCAQLWGETDRGKGAPGPFRKTLDWWWTEASTPIGINLAGPLWSFDPGWRALLHAWHFHPFKARLPWGCAALHCVCPTTSNHSLTKCLPARPVPISDISQPRSPTRN